MATGSLGAAGTARGRKKRARRGVAFAALFFAVALPPSGASAEGSLEVEKTRLARQLGRQGIALFERGAFEDAHLAFRQAYALVPAPTLALREARALAKLGRLVDAAEAYARASRTRLDARSPKVFAIAVADASAELDELRARIPTLALYVEAPPGGIEGLRVTVDGEPLDPVDLGRERRVDPGEHVVEYRLPGGPAQRDRVRLEEGERRELVLRPKPKGSRPRGPWVAEADAPGFPYRTVGWTSVGVGGAALVAGAVTGLLALSAKSDLDAACAGGVCPASSAGDLDRYRTLRGVSAVSYVAGFVGLGAGLGLILASPRGDAPGAPAPGRVSGRGAGRVARAAALEAYVTPSSAGVRGAF